eukprot:scaffold15134_cov101-Isochrysis_galbana.AAC.2
MDGERAGVAQAQATDVAQVVRVRLGCTCHAGRRGRVALAARPFMRDHGSTVSKIIPPTPRAPQP